MPYKRKWQNTGEGGKGWKENISFKTNTHFSEYSFYFKVEECFSKNVRIFSAQAWLDCLFHGLSSVGSNSNTDFPVSYIIFYSTWHNRLTCRGVPFFDISTVQCMLLITAGWGLAYQLLLHFGLAVPTEIRKFESSRASVIRHREYLRKFYAPVSVVGKAGGSHENLSMSIDSVEKWEGLRTQEKHGWNLGVNVCWSGVLRVGPH